jgi:beta-glucosidase
MKKLVLLLCLFALIIKAQAQDAKMDSFIKDLMSKMSVDEKIGQLNLTTAGGFSTGSAVNEQVQKKLKSGQIGGMLNGFSLSSMRASQEMAVKESPNHIPILFGMDVIHGYKTIFPIPLAMSCLWDMSLVEKSARIAAQEATANGIAWTYSPMVDITRDPRWGRIAEGEERIHGLVRRLLQLMSEVTRETICLLITL